MKKAVFHGSKDIIETPKYGFDLLSNDYGRGFYLTESPESAGEWAVNSFRDGYINMYLLDMNGLKVLDLTHDPYNALHWVALLMKNRESNLKYASDKEVINFLLSKYLINVEDYDVIIGYRADDSYYTIARDFVSRRISIRQLEEALRLGKLGKQVVLVSENAFCKLEFVKSMVATREEYLENKLNKESTITTPYFTV